MNMRQHAYQALVDELGGHHQIYDEEAVTLDNPSRFILVECSRYDGELYLTEHDDLESAATYHDSQEEPEDWPIRALYDLDTGERYSGQTAAAYETTFYVDTQHGVPELHGSCSICGGPFNRVAWDNRHSADDGSDVHEYCCPECNETPEQRATGALQRLIEHVDDAPDIDELIAETVRLIFEPRP